MFCPDCFKLLDDNTNCTNPACPSYAGNDASISEIDTVDKNKINETTLNNTSNTEVFKQPKANTINNEIFKQPKINTTSEEIFKQPKINTVTEVFKQPKINTTNGELFKQPKITNNKEVFKQPKINNSNTEIFKQPKANTISDELFKQPKTNNSNSEIFKQPKINTVNDIVIGQPKDDSIDKDFLNKFNFTSEHTNASSESTEISHDDFTKAVPIITESMLNDNIINTTSKSDEGFTKAIPIITESMLNDESLDKQNNNDDIVTDYTHNDDEFPKETINSKPSRKSNSESKNIKTKEERSSQVTPKLDDYFNDDLIDADEIIDNFSTNETLSIRDMLLAYVGKNKRKYYSPQIDSYLENPKFISFNPCACLFTLWWFWYRKVYAPAAIIGVITLISMILFKGLAKFIVILPIALFGGLLGNQIYLKSASKRITKIKSSNKNMDNRSLLKLLRVEGGTTNVPIIFAIVLVLLLIIALTFSAAFIANFIMGSGSL